MIYRENKNADILKMLPGTLENQVHELQQSMINIQMGTNKRGPECPVSSLLIINNTNLLNLSVQVCLDRIAPHSSIFQCGQGHLVCGGCKPRMRREICPTCNGPITGRAHAFEHYLRDNM